MLSVLDIENKKILKKRPYTSVCYDKFFYAAETGKKDEASQVIENYLQHIETRATEAIKYFCKQIKNDKHIGDNIRYDIAYLMSVMWIRSNYFRQQVNKMSEDVTKQMFSFFAECKDNFIKETKQFFREEDISLTEEQLEKIRKEIIDGKYKLNFNNATHLNFFANVEKFANLFYGKNWRVYITTGNYKFITSDTPVIEWSPERRGFYGATFLGRKHYFAMTPDILIETVYPISGKKVRRKRLDDKEVFKLNMLRPEYSLNYCYSDSNEQFEKMLQFVKFINQMSLSREKKEQKTTG